MSFPKELDVLSAMSMLYLVKSFLIFYLFFLYRYDHFIVRRFFLTGNYDPFSKYDGAFDTQMLELAICLNFI